MSIDLERFPWSDSANRMLTYVTKGWYDKSYVGKWIYEVMGRELDLATVHIEELPYQMFIDTATWGLKYHEIKYGLPVREDLSYEERRRLLREKKNTKAPMTPWRMEQILKGVIMMSRFMIVMSLDIIFLTLTYSAFNWKVKQR